MIKKIIILELIVLMCTAFSCGHTHEHSDTMKEVIELNVKLWEDLNATKDEVKFKMTETAQLVGSLDSLRKIEISKKLKALAEQKEKLKELDASIPALEGYEPKCNHEPGEPHTHYNVDINGVQEADLLEIHKELKAQLDQIKEAISK